MKRLSLFWVFLCVLCIHGLCQPVQFTAHTVYQTSSRIFFVAAADFDKDGDQDILYTRPNQDSLQWFENQGGGNFTKRTIGVFPGANSVSVVDIDADGDNDLLASSYTPSKVVLFENAGSQGFILHVLSTDIPHPLTIAPGDIDNDGDYDISCATQDANKGMMLLRNDGNLTFSPINLSAQPYSSTWTMITDLDHDGDLDVLGNNFNNDGGILWYEQTAPLIFTEHLIPFAGTHGFTAADIDGDGDTDLAAVSCGSEVAWFQNDGSNNFTGFVLESGFACAVSVAAADLDQDQRTDLVASAWSANKVTWWKNNGNQGFDMNTVSDSLPKPNSVYVADFNNDSLPDIVSGGYSGKLMWWQNTGHGVSSADLRREDLTRVSFNRETKCLVIDLEPGISPVTASLVSVTGVQTIPDKTFSDSGRLCCDTLKSGLYILNLKSLERTITRKIMINL